MEVGKRKQLPAAFGLIETTGGYRSRLRIAARTFWNGNITAGEFAGSMAAAIRDNLKIAWESGARRAGIKPDELTSEELAAMQAAIDDEIGLLGNLISFILGQLEDGSLGTVFTRLELWVNRWTDLENRAFMMAEGDPKIIWVLGDTGHCDSCKKLAGKVKRKSFWIARGIHPQQPPNSSLDCGGWKCQCRQEETTLPISRGRLPNLP